MKINLYPQICNICGGNVKLVSNEKIYGNTYGSGLCYLCEKCGAYVGTHIPRPTQALGILANARMRKGKIICHEMFDKKWKGKNKAHKKRKDLYCWLANEMNISIEECHFGYFDIDMLIKAYHILKVVENKEMFYENGKIKFKEENNYEKN